MLIDSTNERQRKVHQTRQPRHINTIVEGANTTQRNDSLGQRINQHSPNE